MSVLKLKNGNNILKRTPTIGNGLKFDGVNDYVDIGNALSTYNFNIPTNPYTISIIFKPNSSVRQQLIASDTSGASSNRSIDLHILNSTTIRANHQVNGSGSSATITIPSLDFNKIYNLVFVKNGLVANWGFYVDGILQTKTILSSNDATPLPSTKTTIGAYLDSGAEEFNGKIYDLKIFNKALNQSEVTTLYNSNNNLIPDTAISNLVANYTFNQKNTPVLTGAVLDSSGNNYHGDLINYATPADVTLGATNSWVDEAGNPILV